jgi:hypothetical protein
LPFPRRLFHLAGIYGLIVMLPQYFLEHRIGVDQPPPITHPEYFYGFIGLAVAWQFVFLIIASDPIRYRALMLAAILEKAAFGLAALVLLAQRRIPIPVLVFALIDLAWGTLFAVAYRVTRSTSAMPPSNPLHSEASA